MSTEVYDPAPLPVEYARTHEAMGAAVDRAKANGFTIIKGDMHTLLLDLDGETAMRKEELRLLLELWEEVPVASWWLSKSGGTHVLLRFRKATFNEPEAIAVEAALGSDLKRALLYVARLHNGVDAPRVLFMPRGTLPQPMELPL